MSSLAHTPTAFEIRARARAPADSGAAEPRLRLLPSGDGWSLVGMDGKLVFHALGTKGRRRCLEYAREHGALAVLA